MIFIILILKFNINKKIIIVGTNTPPFEYKKEGKIVGIDIDFLEKIMPELKIDYEIQLMNWDEAINRIKNKEADMILGAGYTEKRESFLYYTEDQKKGSENKSLWIAMDSFYYLKENPLENLSYEYLEKTNRRIGITNGYYYNENIWKYNLNFYSYNTIEQLFEALNNKEIEVIIADQIEASETIKKLNIDKKKISKSKPLTVSQNYILFSKKYENKKIPEEFYNKLLNLKQNNFHETSYEKHLGQNFTEIYNLY